MPVNYCDNCHEPPGCCLCYEAAPDRDEAEEDCLNCGMCESCIDRSIAAAEEAEPTFVPAWDGDYEDA